MKILSQRQFLIFLMVILSSVLPITTFSQTSGIAGIWAIDDCEKITQSDLTHSFISSANNAVWNGSTISLFGAQNEVIAFQLIINANGSGASNVTVRLDSLIGSSYVITNTGGIGDPMNFIGKRIELFVESYINVTTKSTQFIMPAAAPPAYYSGQIPDALVPFEVGQSKGGAPFNIAPNRNQGVWADIYIPKDAPPDIYSGKAVVYENGVVRYNIPVSLKVYGFALSDSTHFRNMFVVDPSDLRTKHGVTYGSSQYYTIIDKYYKISHRHRMDFNVPYNLGNLNRQAAGYFTGSSYTLANGYEGPGANIGHGTYGIGVYDQPNNGGTSGFDPATEAGWRAASDSWVTWFKANAPSTVIFKYMTDEPDSTQYALIKQRASWLHNNPGVGKELKTFCTVKIDPRLYGYIDFWALAGQAGYDAGDHITFGYVSSKVAGRKAAGNKIAIYGDARPSYGLWEVIDVEAADSRVNPWISWKYKVDMFYQWIVNEPTWNGRTINAWVDNYLTFEGGSTYIWGMGNFLYTGQNKVFTAYDKGIPGPIASIRMKNWRRGQQDYEYLWLASQLGLQSQVDSIVNSIVPIAFDGYSRPNSAPSWPLRGYAYELARKKIAELVSPTLTILNTNPSSLLFADVAISTSSERTYTLSGLNLIPASGNITVTAPSSAYQVSLTSGSGFSSSLNIPYTGGNLSSTTIYVRFSPTAVQNYSGNVVNSSVGASTQYVSVTGNGVSTTSPTLIINPTSLTFENVIINTNSSVKTYTVQGTNLSPAAGNIVITPPAGYQVSVGSGMSSSLNVPYTGGMLSSTTIFVRFSPTAVQSYSGNITNTGGGTTTKNVVVTGTGISGATPLIAINPGTLEFSSVRIGEHSSERIYTLQGSYLTPASGNIVITAPTGYGVSGTSGSGYSSSLNVSYTGSTLSSKTIYVVFSPTAEQTYTGNITNAGGGTSTQSVAVSGTGISSTSAALTVRPTSLSFGDIVIDSISSEKSFALMGINLVPSSDSLTITATDGFTLSTQSGSSFTSSKRIAYAGGLLQPIPKNIYVKFLPTAEQNYYGVITCSGGSSAAQTIAISGKGILPPSPTLTVDPGSLSFGNVAESTISGEKTYLLTGSNLSPTSGSITITAPAGFEVSSTPGSGFNSSITISYTSGTISAKTIYGRFLPTLLQSYSGSITNMGGGAAATVSVSGSGALPTITVNPESLPFSSVVINTVSSERIFVLSASNLTPANGSITVTAPSTAFQVSQMTGSGFDSSVSVPYYDGALSSPDTIFVRFLPTLEGGYSGNLTSAGGGATTQIVLVNGTGVLGTASIITTEPTSLLFENVQVNTTSSRKTYTLSGINLSPANGNITVKAPTGFQVSTTSGGGFDSSLTIAYSGGILEPAIIYVRFYPTAELIYTGNITNTGGGAADVSIFVSGSSISSTLTMSPDSLPFGNVIINMSSVKTYALSGSNLYPANDTVKISAPIGFAISTAADSSFKSSLNIPYTNSNLSSDTIYVQFTPAALQSYSGNIVHSFGGIAIQNLPVSGESVVPSLTVSSPSVNFGNVLINSASAESTYTIHGSNLTPASGNIIVTASYGFEVSLTSNSGFNSSINVPYSASSLSSTIIHVRFSPMTADSYTGNITNDGGGATTQNVIVNGLGKKSASLYISEDSLSFGYSIINAISSEKMYALSGANLKTGGSIVITSPRGFQVSATSGAGFDTSISISYSSDTLSLRFVYARFSPTAVENYYGNITNSGGGALPLNIAVSGIGLPLKTIAQLGQNYPNPFNPTTKIPYSIFKKSWVKLTIYNILGQRIKTLINEEQDVGYYQPEFDIAKSNNGQELASGVYFYRLEIAGVPYTKKLILLK